MFALCLVVSHRTTTVIVHIACEHNWNHVFAGTCPGNLDRLPKSNIGAKTLLEEFSAYEGVCSPWCTAALFSI